MNSDFTLEISFTDGLNLLRSASRRFLETINNIPSWLISLQTKVNLIAIQRLGESTLNFAKSALFFLIRASVISLCLVTQTGPFFVGLGFGIFSDTLCERAHRITNIAHFYFSQGSFLKRALIAITCPLALVASIPFSNIALAAYIGLRLGSYLYESTPEGMFRSASYSGSNSLNNSLDVLPQEKVCLSKRKNV